MPGIPGDYIYDENGKIIGATGGKKAALTNRSRYGKKFYKRIGVLGGLKSRNCGFASKKIGADGLAGRERASICGKKGGSTPRKRKR